MGTPPRPPGGPVRRLFRVFDRPPSVTAAVEIELRHHLEAKTEWLVEREGLTPDEAAVEAHRRFGDLERVRAQMETRERKARSDMRRSKLIVQTWEDIRFALRGLRKSPGLAIVAIGTLTLGIGLNTAIFSVVKSVLLDPLPYPEPDRLVWGVGAFSGFAQAAVSPPDYLDYRERSTSFEYLGGRRGAGSYALTGFDRPEIVRGQEVTAEFFEALGGVPVVGRTFSRDDERTSARVIVLSHAFWQNRFGGDPGVLDRALTLDGESYRIVGVMPAGFRLFADPDFWAAIPMYQGGNLVRRFHNLRLVGRLAPGIGIDEAQAELDVIASRLEQEYPESNATWRLPIVPLEQVVVGSVRPLLLILWGAVALVLLIVCANIANLLLARGTGRRSEMAVRTALGATRVRVLRLLFAESLALALAGCAGGIALGVAAVELLPLIDPGTIPRVDEIAIDGGVLAFAAGIALATSIAFGLLPSITASRLDLASVIKTGGRGGGGASGRIRAGLVVVEVAVSFVLLIGAGLLVQSFTRLLATDTGFETRGTAIASIRLPSARYDTQEKLYGFHTALQERIRAVPGVEAVGTASILPLSGGGNDTYMAVPGRHELGTESQFNSQFRFVSRGFFDAIDIPLQSGRGFTDSDRLGSAPVAIINRPFADAIFVDEDPIGQRLLVDLGDAVEVEIIGVVAGVTDFTLAAPPPLVAYFPFAQNATATQQVVIRTRADPATVVNAVPALVQQIDPLQPVARMSTYEEIISGAVAQPRFQTLLLGVFAAVALALAIVGVYGVLSYVVAQRAREVGIRIAVGASGHDIVRLIVKRGLALTAGGLAIGMVASLGLTRYLSSLLYNQISATDAATFAGVAAALAVTSFGASYLPARRAARVDPTETLRGE